MIDIKINDIRGMPAPRPRVTKAGNAYNLKVYTEYKEFLQLKFRGFKMMKREESKKKLWSTGKLNTLAKVECDEILNQVYDDFESRTCENCRYYNTNSLASFCENIDSPSTYHQITEVSFGCNKLESK